MEELGKQGNIDFEKKLIESYNKRQQSNNTNRR